MGLADDLNKLGSEDDVCKLGHLIKTMPPEEAEALENALKSKASTRAIFYEVRKYYEIGKTTMENHRFGRCACGVRYVAQ